jgi:ribose transport system ATP-binding protein
VTGRIGETSPNAILAARSVARSYGAVQALRGVDLDLEAGQVHALLGANGAGKSTLVRILAGAETADSGEILLNGASVADRLSPRLARELGLRFVHQDPQLVPKMTGLQNLMLKESPPRRWGLISWRRSRQLVADAVLQSGLDFDLDTPVERLSLSEQWILAVTRALIGEVRVVAMDEPTASLPNEESGQVYRVVRHLAAQGVAVLYITHRLDEVVELADRVTVLRDGQRSALLSKGEFDVDVLVRAITGSDLDDRTVGSKSSRADPVLEVVNLTRLPRVNGVSFTIHRGEVLGLGGLVGSGRTELARLVFGADRPDAGTMTLGGKPYAPASPREAIARGVALVPEERRSQGLLLKASIGANVALPAWRSFRDARTRLLRTSKVMEAGEAVVARFGVRAPSARTAVGALSGGNQQKVLVGRWLSLDIKVLILDEPTRGVDVGARHEIHRIARGFADGGNAVLMISSELEELNVCDRVVVLREGETVGELHAPDISEAAILASCYPD